MGKGSHRGRLIVISGPSGVGKTTLCERVLERVPAKLSVSVTTRPPRPNEVDGEDYRFCSPEQFERQREAGGFLEWARVFGHCYGTPLAPVAEALDAGQTVLLEIDVQGGLQVARGELADDAVLIFIEPPSAEQWEQALRERLTRRGMDDPEQVERRLGEARAEISLARDSGAYTYFVVNDVLQDAADELVAIINKETARDD